MSYQYRRIWVRDPDTLEYYPVSAAYAARVCGVSLRTAQRWSRTGSPPEPAHRLLTLEVLGVPPCRHWWRYRFRQGRLIHLETHCSVYPGEIQGVAMAWGEAAALRAELRRLGADGRRVVPIKKPGRLAGSG